MRVNPDALDESNPASGPPAPASRAAQGVADRAGQRAR